VGLTARATAEVAWGAGSAVSVTVLDLAFLAGCHV